MCSSGYSSHTAQATARAAQAIVYYYTAQAIAYYYTSSGYSLHTARAIAYKARAVARAAAKAMQ